MTVAKMMDKTNPFWPFHIFQLIIPPNKYGTTIHKSTYTSITGCVMLSNPIIKTNGNKTAIISKKQNRLSETVLI